MIKLFKESRHFLGAEAAGSGSLRVLSVCSVAQGLPRPTRRGRPLWHLRDANPRRSSAAAAARRAHAARGCGSGMRSRRYAQSSYMITLLQHRHSVRVEFLTARTLLPFSPPLSSLNLFTTTEHGHRSCLRCRGRPEAEQETSDEIPGSSLDSRSMSS